MSNEAIRVLHIMTGLVPGGVQSVVLNYAEEMQAQGIVFDYIVQRDNDATIEKHCVENGSRIYRIPNVARYPVCSMVELYRVLKKHPEYSIIHAHQNDLNTFFLLAAQIAGVKVRISHSHSCRPNTSAIKAMIKKVNHLLLRGVATDLWACSKDAFKWLYEKPIDLSNVHRYILHNAVDESVFRFDPVERKRIRNELSLKESFVCACVATLSPNKNQIFLLRVMKELKKRNANIKLVIIGDGSQREELEQFSENNEMSQNVKFLGTRSDVAKLLNAVDCMLLSSRFEGLPISVIEAQANGLPCLLSKGVPQEATIRKDVYYLGTEESDIKKWADCIMNLEMCYSDRWQSMKDQLRVARFELKTEGQYLAQKYRELSKR